MNIIYYVEVNLICISILLLLIFQLRRRFTQLSADEQVLKYLILTTIVFCFSDMFAGIFRGQMFVGARIIIELSNLVYFESLVVIAYLWMKFVCIKINKAPQAKNRIWGQLPLIIFSLVAVTNPFTHLLFLINDKNLYVRNYGITFHWIVTYFYFTVTIILIIRTLILEKNKLRRQEIHPLMYFFIAPLFCSIIQMLVYGITSTQVGVTISIVMIYLSYQSSRILTDSLTGINNRRGLENFLRDFTLHYPKTRLDFLLIDLNSFKQINDRYGHGEGDKALCCTAEVLKDVCKESTGRPFLCRYGGDEFLLALINEDPDTVRQIETNINKLLNEKSINKQTPYSLSASIGIGSGVCSHFDDAIELIQIADKAMYENKQKNRLANRH